MLLAVYVENVYVTVTTDGQSLGDSTAQLRK